jgi:hypothetical protein
MLGKIRCQKLTYGECDTVIPLTRCFPVETSSYLQKAVLQIYLTLGGTAASLFKLNAVVIYFKLEGCLNVCHAVRYFVAPGDCQHIQLYLGRNRHQRYMYLEILFNLVVPAGPPFSASIHSTLILCFCQFISKRLIETHA